MAITELTTFIVANHSFMFMQTHIHSLSIGAAAKLCDVNSDERKTYVKFIAFYIRSVVVNSINE